jgi:DNA-binding MarR family transcriptional regulator
MKICSTFVPTNFVVMIITIEDIIKSTIPIPIERKTLLNIMYTQNYIADRFSEIVKSHDLSGEQYNVLRILRGQKGKPANMCMIQERMLARTSNTTRLVDKLLLKELVTREICPNNRRKMEVQITQKGLDLLTELDPKVNSHEAFFATGMTQDELEQLNTLLEKYRNK